MRGEGSLPPNLPLSQEAVLDGERPMFTLLEIPSLPPCHIHLGTSGICCPTTGQHLIRSLGQHARLRAKGTALNGDSVVAQPQGSSQYISEQIWLLCSKQSSWGFEGGFLDKDKLGKGRTHGWANRTLLQGSGGRSVSGTQVL